MALREHTQRVFGAGFRTGTVWHQYTDPTASADNNQPPTGENGVTPSSAAASPTSSPSTSVTRACATTTASACRSKARRSWRRGSQAGSGSTRSSAVTSRSRHRDPSSVGSAVLYVRWGRRLYVLTLGGMTAGTQFARIGTAMPACADDRRLVGAIGIAQRREARAGWTGAWRSAAGRRRGCRSARCRWAFCSGCELSGEGPSMVVMRLFATASSGIAHERTAAPSRCTVQAPHCAIPQPNLVPVMPRWLRSAHSRGVAASASTATGLPFRSIGSSSVSSRWFRPSGPRNRAGAGSPSPQPRSWESAPRR